MLRRLDCTDVTIEPDECGPEVRTRFAVNPPIVAVTGAIVEIPFGFNPVVHPLVDLRETSSHLIYCQAKEINHHHAAGSLVQVAAIQVRTDMTLQSGDAP